ncbi:hypothetical protein NM688_g8294 [Phlebia brevispora]|uniref:Uncharacterized protein n=1 Tax=Phlebia brevispora TaxID=194682 RepID=A0ACC1RUV5_9APHY|nr:hypothetical protein NM688_g8294 [Phlebia brevispora]
MQTEPQHAPGRSPSRRKSRFTFFVSRRKAGPSRTGSIARRSTLGRATSVKHSRFGSVRDRARASKAFDLAKDDEGIPEAVETTSSSRDCAIVSQERQEGKQTSLSSPQVPPPPAMPTNKNSPLPPVPGAAPKGGLFKRLTTKLHRQHAPAPPQRSFTVPSRPVPLAAATHASTSAQGTTKEKRRATMKLPPLPKPQAPRSTRVNEFTSAQHREAALRAVGLVPARYRDKAGNTLPLSEQEAQMDERFSVLVHEPVWEESEGESEAKQIREAWLRRNVDNEVSESGSERESAAGEDSAVFRNMRTSVMKPQLVEDHPTPPLSPSKAEYGDALPERSLEQSTVDPTAIPLPASPASPRSTHSTPSRGSEEKVTQWLRRTPTASPTKVTDFTQSEKDLVSHEDDDFFARLPALSALPTTRYR